MRNGPTIAALGWRLIRLDNYAARLRAALLGLSALCFTVIAMGLAVAPQVMTDLGDRAAGRRLIPGESGLVRALELGDGYSPADRLWAGQKVSRMYISGSEKSPLPPGIDRLPTPGEVFISPAFQRTKNSEPEFQALISGRKVAGLIAPAGLLSAQENRIIYGSDASDDTLFAGSGFGKAAQYIAGDAATEEREVAGLLYIFITLLVLIPMLALMVISARLSFAQRRTRVLSLSLLGLKQRTIRAILAVESAAVVIPANALGVGAFLLLRKNLSKIPGLDVTFFPEATRPSALLLAGVCLAVISLFVFSAMITGKEPKNSVRVKATAQKPRRIPLVLFFLLVVAVGILNLPGIKISSIQRASIFWACTGLSTICLAWAGPAIIAPISRALARKTTGGGLLVGLKSSAWDPGSSARMASIFAVSFILLGAALTFGNASSRALTPSPQDFTKGASFRVNLTADELRVSGLQKWPEVRQTLPQYSWGSARFATTALVASCQQLAKISTADFSRCTDALPQFITDQREFTQYQRQPTQNPVLKTTKNLRPPFTPTPQWANALVLNDQIATDFSDWRIPPTLLPEKPQAPLVGVIATVDYRDAEVFLARLAATLPLTNASGQYLGQDPGSRQRAGTFNAMTFGMALGLALGGLALCLSGLGDSIGRRARLIGLIALGAPPKEVLRAHFAASSLPVLLLGGLGAGTAYLTYRSFRIGNSDVNLPSTYFIAMGAVSIIMALLLGLITAPPLLNRLTEEEVRSV